jgi:hypothetical protein
MKSLLFILLLLSSAYAQIYRGGFVYEFHDASVPPPYHRSYMIAIEDTVVRFRVDSYGDILLDETYTITGQQLKDFIKKLKSYKFKYTKGTEPNNGCTGGTSDSFFFLWNGTNPQDGYTSQCGGKEYGNIKGKVNEARALFKSMVPDFEIKLGSTRN